MSRHPGHCLDVHAVLKGQYCEGMPQIVESDPRQPCPFQHPVEHMQDIVRGDGTADGRGKYPGAAAVFFCCFRTTIVSLRQGQGAVGVFRFQRGLYDFAVGPSDLPFYPEASMFEVDVFPLQPQ